MPDDIIIIKQDYAKLIFQKEIPLIIITYINIIFIYLLVKKCVEKYDIKNAFSSNTLCF